MKSLEKWGIEHDPSLPFAGVINNFLARIASASRFSATAMFGDMPPPNGESRRWILSKKHGHAGIAILRCPDLLCGNLFNLNLSHQALEIYQQECPIWPDQQKAAQS